MEAYIDDRVVKSKAIEDHLTNLAETFEIMRKHCLKLNASKCAFGISSRKFWGIWSLTEALMTTCICSTTYWDDCGF